MPPLLPSQKEIREALAIEREEALARFFELVHPRLKRIVHFRMDQRLSGRVSESDVIQEAYVRAAQRIDSFLEKDEMPFFVWLRLEVRQKLQELHRHHLAAEKRDVRKEAARSDRGAGQTSRLLAAQLVARVTSPSGRIEREETIALVESALGAMSELDQEVIALRHFEELSNVEAAQVLNIQPAAASKRYLRALQRLRSIMEKIEGLHAK